MMFNCFVELNITNKLFIDLNTQNILKIFCLLFFDVIVDILKFVSKMLLYRGATISIVLYTTSGTIRSFQEDCYTNTNFRSGMDLLLNK